jgi:hypothetical protein
MDQNPSVADQSEPAPSPGVIGRTQAGKKINEYMLLKVLGSKGGRQFWLARLVYGEAQFRISVYPPEEAEGALAVAQTVIRSRIPNIVPVLDCFMDEGIAFVVAPYIEHATLRDTLSEKGALRLERAVAIVADLAETLAAAHKAGLVHGELDPVCVYIDQRGRPLLHGFGPRPVAGAKDGRSDVQGLGRLLGTLLAGKDLADSPLLPPFALRGMRPELPESLIGIIERAASSDGPARYQSCAEMSIYLELQRMALRTIRDVNPNPEPSRAVEAAIQPVPESPEHPMVSPPRTTALALRPLPQADQVATRTEERTPAPDSTTGIPGPIVEVSVTTPEILQAPLASAPSSPVHAAEAVPRVMATPAPKSPCGRCGKPLAPGAHFCRHCGRRTPLASRRRTPLIRASSATLKFCNQCGKPADLLGSVCRPCSEKTMHGGERHAVSELPI